MTMILLVIRSNNDNDDNQRTHWHCTSVLTCFNSLDTGPHTHLDLFAGTTCETGFLRSFHCILESAFGTIIVFLGNLRFREARAQKIVDWLQHSVGKFVAQPSTLVLLVIDKFTGLVDPFCYTTASISG
jgi:hypothetical protein